MLAPISWLKEYVDIKMPIKDLAWRLTELGLGVEAVKNVEREDVLELEITPNRPDLLSIVGIAREIATIQNTKVNLPDTKLPKPAKKLPIKVRNDFSLFFRYTGVVVDDVSIKPSPDWLQKRLILLGLRPINNVVDITNYVMFETGIPLHAFDYEEIKGQEINVTQADGGEDFTSVDELSYKLPKGAIIIKDSQRIIDLCGIKGGLNSGIKNSTKTVYLQVTADNPLLIRRASQALSLRSDASAIFERGVDPGSLLFTLKRAVSLILETGGGEIASDIIDISQKEFKPWNLKLRHKKIEKLLGIEIDKNMVMKILKSLGLNVIARNEVTKQSSSLGKKIATPRFPSGLAMTEYIVTIPTYRGDLKIEEDLIEEVARVYGYNNYPVTIPSGAIPTAQVAYYKDYSLEEKIKQLLVSSGFSEIYTYSLISKTKLDKLGYPVDQAIKVTNPVSADYEYLRPTMIGNVLEALKINLANFNKVNLFEMGRVYLGTPPDTKEPVQLVIAQNSKDLLSLKGSVENFLSRLGFRNLGMRSLNLPISTAQNTTYSFLNVTKSARIYINDIAIGFIGEVRNTVIFNFGVSENVYIASIDIETLRKIPTGIQYKPVPLYPALVEDLALIIKPQTYVGELIENIKKIDKLIKDVDLLDSYNHTRTLRITYQSPEKTLSDKEVKPIREKILKLAEEKFGAKLKAV